MRKYLLLALLAAVLCGVTSAQVLTFEGLANFETVSNFYNGGTGGSGSGPGPSLGITFSANSLSLISALAGGSGNFAKAPTMPTVVFFLSGGAATMNVPAGFTTGFSFFYSAVNVGGNVVVYDGLNATGNVLATLTLPTTSNGGGDPTCGFLNFCPFVPIGIAISGVAKSVDFGGTANQVAYDNITLGSVIPGGAGGCPPHRVHGHINTVPYVHPGQTHEHHGTHGHSVVNNCPPHTPNLHPPSPPPQGTVPGLISRIPPGLGLMPEPSEGLFSLGPIIAAPDFAACLNQDGSFNGETSSVEQVDGVAVLPATRGSVLQLFGSARGLYLGDEDDQPASEFTPPESGAPLYYTTTLPEVHVAGRAVKVLFSGLAPGQKGVWQINILVPADAPAGRLPVTINYEGDDLKSVDIVVR